MGGLTPKQRSARISLERILGTYRGAVLHGDMGVGKTWIACDIAAKYKNVLFVGKAGALKSLKKKIELYQVTTGNILNIELMSYDKFRDYDKVPASSLGKYDLFIWDECFSGDTEVLTDSGFQRLDSLNKNSKVAQVEEETLKIDFVKPTKYIKTRPNSDMLKLSLGNGVTVDTTAKHEFLVFNRLLNKWEKRHAEKVPGKGYIRIPVAGSGTGSDVLTSEERLAIAFQADGTRIDKRYTKVRFSFSKERKIKDFLQLMQEGGFKHSEGKPRVFNNKKWKTARNFYLKMDVMSKDLWSIFDITNISEVKAKKMLKEIEKWDSQSKKNGFVFSSADVRQCEFVQAVAVLAGYHTKLSSFKRQKPHHSDRHIVGITYKKFIGTQSMKKEVIKKPDYVYCVSVPKGNIVIRSKGKVFITGNCHKLKNYPAGWTTRYVRLSKGKHLHLSGTPLVNSPKDFLYVLRKCGLFESTEWFYKRYFGATKSHYGDFMEKGEFRNEHCFQNHVDRVTVRLTKKDVQPDMPDVNFHIVPLPGDYTPPEDITKETKTRINAGLTKVQPASKNIRKVIRDRGITTGLVLCYFHDVAKEMAKELDFPVALTKEKVYKEFERISKEGGFLITTLGLTSSSLDLNECDNVFMIESTYSYPLDMQSVERCQRLGKKNDIDVYYYSLEGETSIAKSFSRQSLLDNMHRSKLSPSQLSRLEKCPGSYWLPALDDKPEYIEGAANEGTKMHEIVERYLTNTKIGVPRSTHENITGMIKYCRGLISTAQYSGVESKVNMFSMHPDLKGTADFWAFDGETMWVVDYKNGSSAVSVQNNLQLIAYTLMISHTYRLTPKYIQHVIYQRGDKKTCFYEGTVVKSWEKRIKRIVDRVMDAEREPLKHLNQDTSCDFFCPAREYHNKEDNMSRQFTAADRQYSRVTLTGELFYVQTKATKTGKSLLNLGLWFTELPEELKTAFPAGSAEEISLKQVVQWNDQYKNFSCFLNGFPPNIKGEQNLSRYDEVRIEARIKPPSASFNKVSFNIVNIELLQPANAGQATTQSAPAVQAQPAVAQAPVAQATVQPAAAPAGSNPWAR